MPLKSGLLCAAAGRISSAVTAHNLFILPIDASKQAVSVKRWCGALSSLFRNVPVVSSLEVSLFFFPNQLLSLGSGPLPERSPARPLGRAFRAERRQWLAS